jgi:hypothetical protein
MINPGDDGVIIKDPSTGMGNFLPNVKDAVIYEAHKGLCEGKRLLKGSGVGFSSYATEILNANVLHYTFPVDGKRYHLSGTAGGPSGKGAITIRPLE